MNNLFKLIIINLLLISSIGIRAQELNSKAFKSGEHLTYQASYNMSGLLTTFAQVDMKTAAVRTKKKSYMHLKCTAYTYKKWDDFFKIRDLYEAYINPYTSTPYLYKRDTNEKGTIRKETYKYKGNIVDATYVRGQSGVIPATFNISPETKDVVSTLYYLRNLPIHTARVGDNKDFNVVFDRKIKKVTLQFLGKEKINTVLGEKECYKISVALKRENLLKGNNIIYLTADKNKVPVLIEFNIPVGNGQLKLTQAKNLKY
ncbi:DUF3108 domain-containing protein [Pseudofulvibacter geojedonensis]|uniref:DUF3108 domain-containing protein n=1 Tax=Pseudofulvibacter geojedonensis TaxID=1123758 RepID=A0ABW3HYD8_9FLAO